MHRIGVSFFYIFISIYTFVCLPPYHLSTSLSDFQTDCGPAGRLEGLRRRAQQRRLAGTPSSEQCPETYTGKKHKTLEYMYFSKISYRY